MAEARIEAQFDRLVQQIGQIGLDYHAKSVLANAAYNARFVQQSIRNLSAPSGAKAKSAIIVSAGPSVRQRKSISRIKASGYSGTVVATDGSYVACLKEGLVPDYVICLDPHPTRIVRWFGDPDIEAHSRNDDYYERQDLNIDFRNNTLKTNLDNIELVNRHAHATAAVFATTVDRTVTERARQAGFPIYWWHPLMDNPTAPDSLTGKIHRLVNLPCLNTGGTVGTAAWMIAAVTLKIPNIAVVGMEGGTLVDDSIDCIFLDDFTAKFKE